MHSAIVLVHGAFAESASRDAVIDSLLEAATSVLATANPLRGLATDAGQITGLVSPSDGTTDLSITQDRFHARSAADLPAGQVALRAAGLAWAADEHADGCDQGVLGGSTAMAKPTWSGSVPAPASRGRSLPALNGRVHAPAACVLVFRVVHSRRDQARHLRLSPAMGAFPVPN